jgi:uncharacterized protein
MIQIFNLMFNQICLMTMKKNPLNFGLPAFTFSLKLIEQNSLNSAILRRLFFVFSFILPFLGNSQVSITSSTPYTQDFNALANTGTSSTLPTGWFLSEAGTNANANYTAGTGSSGTGETYSFGSASSTDRAFGGLQSGSLITTIGGAFTNNTGSTISSLAISYVGEQWRLGTLNRVDRLDFQYSTDATSLITGTWTNFDELDFVAPVTTGTVGALDGNAIANRTAKSGNISSLSLSNGSTLWIRWNDFNASGSDDGLGIDDFSLTPTIAVSGLPNISINDVSLTEGNSGTSNMTFTISLAAPAPVGGVTYDITTVNGTASSATDYVAQLLTGQTIAEGVSSATFTVVINGDVDYELNETFNVTLSNVTNANIADGTGVGTITNDDAPTYVKISAIQGSGTTAALTGLQHIEGIVTRTFLGSSKLNGFYVQEEDADVDGNALTSEGIFVFDPAGLFSGSVGDKVQVSGTVIDLATGSAGSSLTQMTSLIGVTILSSGNVLPAITNVQLPVTNVSDLERYEGMLVNVSASTGNLTVTETFGLHQFGQVLLSSTGASNQPGTDARIDQYTQFNAPSVAGNAAYQLEIAKRLIYLDDGISMSYPSIHIFGRGGNPLSTTNTLRAGDEVTDITAILDHRFEGYRLQTTSGVNFQPTNARSTTPSSVGGTLKVGSFNVLNYFSSTTYPTARGASTALEFTRQRDKTIQSILQSGVDIMGLNELEDNSNGAIQDLVNGLNAIAGAGTYAFINTGDISDDEITVGMIYKPSVVTPTGASAAIPFAYGSGSFGVVNRRSLAQTFTQISSGAIFTLVANHFKSKGSGSGGGAGDADSGDGQAAFNGTRNRQAQDLLAWIATKPTGTNDPDYLIVGDLNAYAMEEPITTLSAGGFTAVLPNTSYSYAFRGQFGSLDHALANSSLATQVTGATKWHINSDEPTILDYNTENKTIAQQSALYNADPFRTSDHDPVIVGLSLTGTTFPVELIQFAGNALNAKVRLNWITATEINSSHFDIERSINGVKFEKVGEVKAQGGSNVKRNYFFDNANPINGLNYYRLKMVDKDATFDYSKTITVDYSNSGNKKSTKIYPNPTSSVLNVENAENFKMLKIYTIQGLLVLQSNQLEVNVSALNIGLYMVEVENTEGVRTMVRFLKN